MVSILIIFPKILSILSQIYTLPTLQDDSTVLQHHPYQIQRLETSYLAKRNGPIATVYWDASGAIKTIFNMDINIRIVQLLAWSGVSLAHSVLADCRQWMQNPFSPAFVILRRVSLGSTTGLSLEEHS